MFKKFIDVLGSTGRLSFGRLFLAFEEITFTWNINDLPDFNYLVNIYVPVFCICTKKPLFS